MNAQPRRSPLTTTRFFASSVGGFTIIELMVTLGIVVLATGLVMIRYASFNSSVLLSSLAYEVAFDLRETQSLSISVRGNERVFRQEYGMHFDITTPNQYILMQDSDGGANDQDLKTGDPYITYEDGEGVGEPIIVDPRFTIVDICATSSGGARSCYYGVDGTTGSNVPEFVTVAFARPDFDAVMHGEGIGALSSAEILFGPGNNSSGIYRTVVVNANGQIKVE